MLVHLGEVLAQLRALGLERGNDAGVHQLPAIALDGATTLGEHGEQSLGTAAQLFDAHEFVVHAGVSACGQLRFGCHHGGIQARQLGAQRALGLFTRELVARQVRESRLEARDLATGEIRLQRTHFGDQRTVTTRGICLTLERLQVPAHLAQQVLCAQQVGLGALETTLGLLLALAVLQHTRCFFDDRATIFGRVAQHFVDATLTDDDVLLTTDTGVREQLLHVEESALHAVDRVLALAGAEERAADGDLGEIDRQQPLRVVDGEHHLGTTEGGATGGAVEDDVVHLLAAHGLRGLCAEHPGDRIHDVGLARAVGADHHGHAGLELHRGGVGEGLEALEGQGFEEHVRQRE